jgi:pimeloyl-ACP methyl ester carboxylesterase
LSTSRQGAGRPYDRRVEPTSAVHRVRLDTGVTLTYAETGDSGGTPVLLLHAWVESRRCFDRLIPLLPETVHCFAIDLRGHGDSDKPEEGYELTDFAADVTSFITACDLSGVVLVGSSSGGYIAQQVAIASPREVSALVLVGAPRDLQGSPPFADEIESLRDPIDPEWVQSSLAWYPTFSPIPLSYIEDRIRDGATTPAHVWRQSLSGLCSAQPPTRAGTIRADTLVIGGSRDELLSPDEQRALAAAIPGSTLLLYEDTGHLVLWERPGRVAADLRAFIAGL